MFAKLLNVKYHTLMKTLASLLEVIGIEDSMQSESIQIQTISQHSKQCTPNSVFFAFNGLRTDGNLFIQEAINQGAVCIISGQDLSRLPLPSHILWYQVEKPHTAFARMCSALYDRPQDNLGIIGVSGTDGKSTTCDYLYQLLWMNGVKAGLLTTVSMDDGSGKVDSPYRQSTPEPDQLHAFLHRCVQNNVKKVVLECTSHALSNTFDRLAGIEFEAAIVTKVTSEHLEFHHSLEEYTQAKVNLVRSLKDGGLFLTSTDNAKLEAFTTALRPTTHALILGKDIPLRIESLGYQGVVVDVSGQRIQTPLLLPSLATNALLAVFCASHLTGLETKTLLPLIKSLKPVKGRMHLIENSLGLRVIIDFAHTADAYEGIFFFAKRTCEGGDLIAVFGCAGERDTSKRSPMGRIANKYCSTIILTEEDPRREGNQTIFSDLRFLMDNPSCRVWEIESRREAIRKAVSIAQSGDTLLFLGKGHEKTIERMDEKISWDEVEEVREALRLAQEKQP